jgi:hypothetical protein
MQATLRRLRTPSSILRVRLTESKAFQSTKRSLNLDTREKAVRRRKTKAKKFLQKNGIGADRLIIYYVFIKSHIPSNLVHSMDQLLP